MSVKDKLYRLVGLKHYTKTEINGLLTNITPTSTPLNVLGEGDFCVRVTFLEEDGTPIEGFLATDGGGLCKLINGVCEFRWYKDIYKNYFLVTNYYNSSHSLISEYVGGYLYRWEDITNSYPSDYWNGYMTPRENYDENNTENNGYTMLYVESIRPFGIVDSNVEFNYNEDNVAWETDLVKDLPDLVEITLQKNQGFNEETVPSNQQQEI